MVFFAYGSHHLGPVDLSEIDDVVQAWRASHDKKIGISIGGDGMATKRVAAIKAALMRRGVPAKAIVVQFDHGNSRIVGLDLVAAAPTCG